MKPVPVGYEWLLSPGRVDHDRDDGPGFDVSPFRLFASQFNLHSKVYSSRWDEARRNSIADANAMYRDAYFQALIQERTSPLCRWEWDVTPDPDEEPEPTLTTGPLGAAGAVNTKDPGSADREKIAKSVAACCRRVPKLHQLRAYLGKAVWFGRYGAQVRWDNGLVAGSARRIVGAHDPINGDKIHHGFDGTPGVMIAPNTPYMIRDERNPNGWDVRTFDNFGKVLMLDRPDLRNRFIIHQHAVEDADYMDGQAAGRRHGVGLRDYVYWAWFMRDEMLAWLMGFMEKAGSLGILCFFYHETNKESKAAAEAAAKKVGNGNALIIPVKANDPKVGTVELIPANLTGVGFLKDVIADTFERHIERLFVGQTLSSGTEGSGLGGTGVAEMHAETKMNLLRWDAENQAETFTTDLVRPTVEYNFPGCPYRFIWTYKLPDPKAKEKLEAGTKLITAGVTIKTDEIREAGGYSKPAPGEETVGGQQPGMGLPGGPGGGPDAAGGGVVDPNAPDGGQPTPGMAELVTAMVKAGAAGNVQAVKALAKLGGSADKLQAIVDESGTEQPAPAEYRWAAASSTAGSVKAVWQGMGERKPLYGAEAEAALRGQDAGREKPEPAGQGTPKAARAPADVFAAAIADPGSVGVHELESLAGHLATVPTAELAKAAATLEAKVRPQLVERIMAAVGAVAKSTDSQNLPNPSETPNPAPENQTATLQSDRPAERFLNLSGVPAVEGGSADPPSENAKSPEKSEVEGSTTQNAAPAAPRATVVSATPGKGTAAPALGNGPGKHPLADWVKLHADRKATAAAATIRPNMQKRDFSGPTKAAQERWAKNTAATEKYLNDLKKKIDTLDKKESWASYLRKNGIKVKFDSAMESVYGSMKDAYESGFPRGLLSKSEGTSIDVLAQQFQSMGKGGDELGGDTRTTHAHEILIEKIVSGARADAIDSGERHRLAEELYHLEANRDHGLADNKLAEIIRSGRKAGTRKARSGGSRGDGQGSGNVASPPKGEPAGEWSDGSPVGEDVGYDPADDPEHGYGHAESEADLDEIFNFPGNSEAKEDGSRDPSSDDPFAGDSAPEWYDDYRGLRNRADMGGRLSADESKKLEELEKKIRTMSGVTAGTYRAPADGMTPGHWWGTLTYAERAVVVGSANHRRWAQGLRGTAARTPYGKDDSLDAFIEKAAEYHQRQTVRP